VRVLEVLEVCARAARLLHLSLPQPRTWGELLGPRFFRFVRYFRFFRFFGFFATCAIPTHSSRTILALRNIAEDRGGLKVMPVR